MWVVQCSKSVTYLCEHSYLITLRNMKTGHVRSHPMVVTYLLGWLWTSTCTLYMYEINSLQILKGEETLKPWSLISTLCKLYNYVSSSGSHMYSVFILLQNILFIKDAPQLNWCVTFLRKPAATIIEFQCRTYYQDDFIKFTVCISKW